MSGVYWTMSCNPVIGCIPASEGCANCYAERLAATRLRRPGNPYDEVLTVGTGDRARWNGETRWNPDALNKLRTRKPQVVFISNMGDLFGDRIPSGWIAWMLHTMLEHPQHTYLVLTKHVRRMWEILRDSVPQPNIYVGATVENQARADERMSDLLVLAAQGWRTWLSYEPALGPIDLEDALWRDCGIIDGPGGRRTHEWEPHVSWVVAGGETGPGARACNPDWLRATRDQCAAACVPLWLKQVDATKSRLLDGREHNEVPWK